MIEAFITIGVISIIIYLLILLYIIIGIMRSKQERTYEEPFVSIIVSAHNEERNISRCIQKLLNQNYADNKLEIIIIDDRSNDRTGKIISKYSEENVCLHVININESNEKNISHKKYALSKAIKAAKGDIIVTTDADCYPGPNWVQMIVSSFTPKTGMVVSLAPLKRSVWFISPLLCIDAMMATLAACGSAGYGHPVAATGRNLAYRKVTFNEVDGYSNLMHILSGDDILLLQKVFKQTNWEIRFQSHPDALVFSVAAEGWKQYITQKMRHIYSSKYFPLFIQVGFSALFFSKLVIFLVTILSILHYGIFHLLNMLFLSSYLVTFSLFYFISKKSGQTNLLIYYPLWEIHYLLSHIIIAPLGLLGKVRWGGRQIN